MTTRLTLPRLARSLGLVALCTACDEPISPRDVIALDATDAIASDAVDGSISDVTSDAAPADTGPDVTTPADATILRPPDVPAGTGCGALAFCDDFEDTAPTMPPSPARWTVASPNCSGSGRLAVDGVIAHHGARSVRIDGGGGYCDHVFLRNASALAAIGTTVYGRFYLRLGEAPGDGHVTFLALRDAADGDRDLRMGGQSRIFMWNRESDDATLPELSPVGISRSLRPEAGRWYCVEFGLDSDAGTLQTWVDGVPVSGLTIDGTPTADLDARWLARGAWRPRVTDFRLGWESYAGQAVTLWFDDVALDARRIGCGP